MLGVCGPLQTVINEMLKNGASMDAQLEYDINQAIEGLERISQQFHRSWEAGAANTALHVIHRLSAPVVPTADCRLPRRFRSAFQPVLAPSVEDQGPIRLSQHRGAGLVERMAGSARRRTEA